MKTRSRSNPRSNGNGRTRAPWRPSAKRQRAPAFGYASVPTDVSLEGPEVAAQRLSIETACERLGLDLVDLVRDHEPQHSEPEERPGLAYALDRIGAGDASCLIVSGLERLSQEVAELAYLVDRLEQTGVRLIAVDVGLDTATADGRLVLYRRPVPAVPGAPEIEIPTVDRAELVPEEPAVVGEHPLEEALQREDAAFVPEQQLGAAFAEEQPLADEQEDAAAEAPTEEAFEEKAPPAPEAPSRPALHVVPAPPPEGADPVQETVAATRALGYASVPVEDDGGDGRDLEVQKTAIQESCNQYGFELVELVRDREPKAGKALDRAGLSYALGRIAAGEASCLVVDGLERLSRSVAELGTLVQWLEQNDVRLVAVDLKLDTATPGGRTTARALASVGGWERERLSERTRKGLAAARAKRHETGGPATPDWGDLRKRIAAMRADGMTLQAIADALNQEGVPTPRGGAKWRPSSVQTAAGYKRRSRPRQVEDLPGVDQPPKAPGGRPPASPPAG